MQERDNLKDEENRLKKEIEKFEEKANAMEQELESTNTEHAKETEKLNAKITDTQRKLKSMTEDRDSRIKRTRLLLDIQKKYEKQQNEAYEQYEELKKISDELKERVKDRDALEVEVIKYQKRSKELEAEIESLGSGSQGGEMPWDVDPELQDMSARELKAILGNDLTAREKIKLNEMCVVELEKDLKAVESKETAYIMEITSLKTDLKKTTVKLNHLQSQRSAVKAALDEDTESNKSAKTSSTVVNTRKSARFQDENATENNAKKAKLMPAAQENDVRSTRSRRSRASHLDKGMPDNPFTKKVSKVRPRYLSLLRLTFF